MTRGERIRELFDRLAGLPEHEVRAALTEESDPQVREAVKALLAADEDPLPILAATPDELAAAVGEPQGPGVERLLGTTIGRYRIESLIGVGGMGTVYLAVREDLGMKVALKLLRGALGDPQRVARFKQEERVLAQLSHPLIAQILDAGVAPDGTPFLAMAYVDGTPLTQWCLDRGLSVPRRLELFDSLCEAVAFAHKNLVVHRDLKPSNVMVTREGVVSLLDFGVAKLIDEEIDHPGLTHTGMRVVSPAYATPEQVTGGPISTATDIYGLGLLLYEMLAGRRPYARDERQAARLFRAVLNEEPEPLSEAMEPRPHAVRDLDAICLKALAKSPSDRYRSVDALRDDVRRYLEGRPVAARLPTRLYRTGKFLRRNQARVAVGALVAALALVAGGSAAWQGYQTRAALAEAQDLTAFLVRVFQSNDPRETRGTDMPLKSFLDLGRVYVEDLEARPELQGRTLEVLSLGYLEIGEYERAEELATLSLEKRLALGVGHEAEVASSLRAQGRARLEAQELAGAETVLRTALALQRQALGDDDPETTETMLVLAQAIRDQGALDEAESLTRESLSRRLRVRRSGDEDGIVSAMTALARVLALNGRTAIVAEDLLRKGLEIRERLYGLDDFRVEPSVSALADFLDASDQGEEAEALARRSLALRRRVYGEEHPRVTAEQTVLASTLLTQGRAEEARDLLRQVVRRYEDTYGGDHLMLALAIEEVSGTFLAQERYDSAEVYLRKAHSMRLRLEGEEDPDVAALHHLLGEVEERSGRLEDAEASLRLAIGQRLRFLGPESPLTLRSQALLGSVLTDLGRLDEAEPLLRETVRVQRQVLGEPPTDLVRSLGSLGRILRLRGSWEEAEDAYAEALLIARTGRSVGDPVRVAAARSMADFYVDRGRPDEAERIWREEEGTATAAREPQRREAVEIPKPR